MSSLQPLNMLKGHFILHCDVRFNSLLLPFQVDPTTKNTIYKREIKQEQQNSLSNYDHIIIYKLKSSPSAKKFVTLLKSWSPVVQVGGASLPTQVRIQCRLQSMARQEKRTCLDSCYHFTRECLDMVPTGAAGPRCMVLLSGGFRGTASPFMPHRWLFTRPVLARTTPILLYKQSPLLALPFQATSQTCSSKNHLPFNSVPPLQKKRLKKKVQ